MAGPRSMTGFGRAEGQWQGAKVTVEMRSLNHRFLDVRIKLPREMAAHEQSIMDLVKAGLGRGKVDVSVTISGIVDSSSKPSLNMPLVKTYVGFIKQIENELGRPAAIDPGLILSLKDVILFDESVKDVEAEWEALKTVVDVALNGLLEAGQAEGARLIDDLKGRIERLGSLAGEMRDAQPDEIKAYRERLGERISELACKPDVDPERLAQEVIYFAERCDCTEEMVRFKAHRQRFLDLIARGGQVGRSLDFLVQEMGREINTTASKALSASVSHAAVEAKSELEKIREQIQNLE